MIPENLNPGNNGYYHPGNYDANEIKKIVQKILYNWYWFLLTIGIAVTVAFIYNRYTPQVYEIQSTLLVNEENSNSPLSALYGRDQGMFQERYFTDRTNIYNQVAILSSTPIVTMALAELDFEVSYYSLGRFSETEIYNNIPFRIIWDRNHPQVVDGDFYLTIQPDGTMDVSIESENVRVYSYSENRMIQMLPSLSFHQNIEPDSGVVTDQFSFKIAVDEPITSFEQGNYMFRFHTPTSLVNRYRSMLKVMLPDNNSSIIYLSVRDQNVGKGTEFLNKLIEIYQYSNLEKKNQYANLTIQFIDSQLQNISDSLSISENRLETFRSANQMINFSAQSQQLLMQINELDKELMKRETQHKYYTYLKEYIESNQDLETVIAPSSVGIDDPLLNSFIVQLNELINKKSSQTSIRPNSDHPTFVQLNNQIETVKNSLIQSVNNIISQSKTELETLRQRMGNYNAQVRRLPATERNFVNFERKYRIDSETYTFLLQKLSEARIVKASNIPDGQVLESPQMYAVVKPQRRKVFSIAILLGMIVPAGIILLYEFFNNRINSLDDIRLLTTCPIIGEVPHNGDGFESHSLVLDKPNSPVSNSYVAIRTKLHLLTKEKHPVIAVSSSYAKEGKTYNALNIASSIALSHKTAVLLDLDLRNSHLARILGINDNTGIGDYLDDNANLEEITFDTPLPRLKVIPSGAIPSNPAELLTHEKLPGLLEILKETYDFIIIDTPPVGLVADIYQLNELIDGLILVVRQNYTKKQELKQVIEELQNQKRNSIGIILNNVYRRKKNSRYQQMYDVKEVYNKKLQAV